MYPNLIMGIFILWNSLFEVRQKPSKVIESRSGFPHLRLFPIKTTAWGGCHMYFYHERDIYFHSIYTSRGLWVTAATAPVTARYHQCVSERSPLHILMEGGLSLNGEYYGYMHIMTEVHCRTQNVYLTPIILHYPALKLTDQGQTKRNSSF